MSSQGQVHGSRNKPWASPRLISGPKADNVHNVGLHDCLRAWLWRQADKGREMVEWEPLCAGQRCAVVLVTAWPAMRWHGGAEGVIPSSLDLLRSILIWTFESWKNTTKITFFLSLGRKWCSLIGCWAGRCRLRISSTIIVIYKLLFMYWTRVIYEWT